MTQVEITKPDGTKENHTIMDGSTVKVEGMTPTTDWKLDTKDSLGVTDSIEFVGPRPKK